MTRPSVLPSPPPAEAERFVLAGDLRDHPPRGSLTPPTGFPLAPLDILAALAGPRSAAAAERALAAALGVPWAVTLDSGRAALALLLIEIHRRTPARTEVVLPAYGCFTLASAVVRAGLRIRLVDLVPEGFDLDPAELAAVAGKETLAVVAPHLLGYPIALAPLKRVADAAGALVIDDAAQALGARADGDYAGAGGRAGILSFGRGKPLSALGGGAIVTRDLDLASDLASAVAALPVRDAPPARIGRAAAAALYTPLLHPWLYALAARIPALHVGCTEYDPGFPLARLDGFRAALMARGLSRLAFVNAARRRNAAQWETYLHGIPGFTPIAPRPGTEPVTLRLPVLCATADLRARALHALRRLGLGASRLYPAPLTVIPALARVSPDARRDFPAARDLAERLLCLPIYPHLDERRIRTGAAVLRTLASSMRAVASPVPLAAEGMR